MLEEDAAEGAPRVIVIKKREPEPTPTEPDFYMDEEDDEGGFMQGQLGNSWEIQ
jgi:hypothetical protein